MTFQTASRILVALHRETAINVQATATGAVQMRLIGGSGSNLKRANVQSVEKLTTGLTSMARNGYKSVDGSYDAEMSVGGALDMVVEAVNRSTWATSTSVGFGTLTTIAIGTNTLTAAAGSFLTQGVRVGDIFQLSGTTVSGNNNTNHIVVSVATLTLVTTTLAFTTLAATATGTLTILKKLVSPTGVPTRYSHTIEQYDQDIDLSELFTGCRAIGLKLSFQPGQMAKATYSFLGVDRTALATGTSPYFTSPSLTTSLGLLADDSTIRMNGAPVASFTGFDLNFQITAAGVPVIGSLTTPDIFDNNLAVSGTITGLRQDFSNLTLFDAETEFEISILLQEPSGAPPNAFSIYIPRAKIGALSAPVGGGDGAKVETLEIRVGPKTADSSHDYGVATFCSSGA